VTLLIGQKYNRYQMAPILTANSEQLLESTAYNRNERFAARFYGVDTETVRGWRKRGRGPRYKKINGKLIRYSLEDLIAWAESQPGSGDRTA
jgi:Helix-turn-helix domain